MHFAAKVAQRFHEDRCLELASSLAFTTVLAVVPLITVALTVTSAIPSSDTLVEGINEFVAERMLPDETRVAITGHVEQFISNAARLTVLGLAILAGTAIARMYSIERTFISIWRVRPPLSWCTARSRRCRCSCSGSIRPGS